MAKRVLRSASRRAERKRPSPEEEELAAQARGAALQPLSPLELLPTPAHIAIASMLNVKDLGAVTESARRLLATYAAQQRALALQWAGRYPSLDDEMRAWGEPLIVLLLARRTGLTKLSIRGAKAMLGVARALESGFIPRLGELRFEQAPTRDNFRLLGQILSARMTLGCSGLTTLHFNAVYGRYGLDEVLLSGACTGLHHLHFDYLSDQIAVGRYLTSTSAADLLSLRIKGWEWGGGTSGQALVALGGPNIAPHVETLHLEQVYLGGSPLAALVRAIEKGKWGSLRELSLVKVNVTHGNLESLMNAFLTSGGRPLLKDLNLSGTGVGPGAAAALGRLLRDHTFPSLECLNLNTCSMSSQALEALAAGLEAGQGPGPRRLDLASNPVDSQGVLHLSRALRGPAGAELTDLDISHVDMGPEGAQGLAEALSHLSRLEKLRMGGNGLGDAGMLPLAQAMRGGAVPHLTHLDITRVGMRDDGLVALAEALENGACTHLSILTISEGGISTRGATRFAEALQAGGGAELTELSLTCSSMLGVLGFSQTNEGVEALAEAVVQGSCPLLTILRVYPTISQEVKARLKAARPSLVQR